MLLSNEPIAFRLEQAGIVLDIAFKLRRSELTAEEGKQALLEAGVTPLELQTLERPELDWGNVMYHPIVEERGTVLWNRITKDSRQLVDLVGGQVVSEIDRKAFIRNAAEVAARAMIHLEYGGEDPTVVDGYLVPYVPMMHGAMPGDFVRANGAPVHDTFIGDSSKTTGKDHVDVRRILISDGKGDEIMLGMREQEELDSLTKEYYIKLSEAAKRRDYDWMERKMTHYAERMRDLILEAEADGIILSANDRSLGHATPPLDSHYWSISSQVHNVPVIAENVHPYLPKPFSVRAKCLLMRVPEGEPEGEDVKTFNYKLTTYVPPSFVSLEETGLIAEGGGEEVDCK